MFHIVRAYYNQMFRLRNTAERVEHAIHQSALLWRDTDATTKCHLILAVAEEIDYPSKQISWLYDNRIVCIWIIMTLLWLNVT